jgi:hypothetical protein
VIAATADRVAPRLFRWRAQHASRPSCLIPYYTASTQSTAGCTAVLGCFCQSSFFPQGATVIAHRRPSAGGIVSRLQSSGCVGFGQAVRSFERWALANLHFMQCRKCCGWMGQTAARLAGRCGSNLSPAPESLVEDVGQQSNTNDRSAAVLSLEPRHAIGQHGRWYLSRVACRRQPNHRYSYFTYQVSDSKGSDAVILVQHASAQEILRVFPNHASAWRRCNVPYMYTMICRQHRRITMMA